MAPPRYGQTSMNGPYSHLQQNHLPSHSQGQNHGILPPPHLAAAPNFGPGSSTRANPFGLAGANTNGFERGMGDAGSLLGAQPGQSAFMRAGQVPSHPGYDGPQHGTAIREDPRIRNVWKHNLHQEMANLRTLVDRYPYIAMDTEFPGIVARPIGSFTTKADYHYQTLRCNVDLLKMIQLGITLFSPEGQLPSDDPTNVVPMPCTWQFNFHFSLSSDMYASDSTTMLSKAGLEFEKHEQHGIEPDKFGALLISSGLVLDPHVKWISFHSGYDFGYLMKIMICQALPDDENKFHIYLDKFFPSLFDIKFIIKHVGSRGAVNNNQTLSPEASLIIQNCSQKSGLQDLANELGIPRIGIQHQAGSDSLLTGQVFFKMQDKIFNGVIEEERYVGQVWGLNGQMPMSNIGPLTTGNTPNMNGGATAFYVGGAASSGNPSTPQTGHVALAQNQTPVPPQSAHGSSLGTLTPGPGVFGNFQYGGRAT